jgi:hypothetical protein
MYSKDVRSVVRAATAFGENGYTVNGAKDGVSPMLSAHTTEVVFRIVEHRLLERLRLQRRPDFSRRAPAPIFGWAVRLSAVTTC